MQVRFRLCLGLANRPVCEAGLFSPDPLKETARVPPLLDSPQSAAPETFLSRDAVSAFPLLFEPLPHWLPNVRCREWVARALLLWRFCVNLSPLPSDRGDRPILFPASDSQFRRRSMPARDPCAYRAAPQSGMKIRALVYRVQEWKFPGRPARHR